MRILCLNGGGVRGALQVGALRALETQELHTVFQDGVYGISIGAITCALIAFKFTTDEIVQITRDILKIETLIDKPRLAHLLELPSRLGLDTGEKTHECLKNIFKTKQLDFDSLTVGDASIPLYIVASDLTRCKIVVFNESVKLWDALRASIALPLVFTPHTIHGRVFVDGAVLCKNIVLRVPPSQRKDMLVLLSNNFKSSSMNSASSFMNRVMHAPSVAETLKMTRLYPNNVCMLTENETDMIDLNPDIDKLLNVGESLCRDFLAKRLH